MTPDTTRVQRGGLIALAAAVLAVAGMAWYGWMDQPEIAARLAAARTAAQKIAGQEPLRERVERQRKANAELEENIATLKRTTGLVPHPPFIVPDNWPQKASYFFDTFQNVSQDLCSNAEKKRILCDEFLGFPRTKELVAEDKVPTTLTMLQLTKQALAVVLAAPDPVVSLNISHGEPVDTGPDGRPTLLKEYPLTLKLRGSLKTILWILHRYGQREDGECPLILRGLSIQSLNAQARGDIQQLDATFELAAMSFIPDAVRAPGAARTTPSPNAGKARP